ncbi:cobalt ECF transporter T component CbiQ [Pseudoramibacter alactolyticus]|uniref:cobalt ECF transporter T component CbiQ n=1 Tax=Pseudoramibacter alactolyticus TaxID=113287 RepID=UPI0028ED8D26|nr:cobalt ECF transporter T component CbiQ [Pseudoramibacter alactolyticus]
MKLNVTHFLWLVPPLLLLIGGGIYKVYRHRGEARHSHGGFGHKHGESTLSIDIYAYNSAISEWNPSFKIGFGIILLLMCIISNNPYVSFSIILFTFFVTVVLGELDLRNYISLLTIPLVFMIAGSIFVLFEFSKTPYDNALINFFAHWGYVIITPKTLYNTAILWSKAFGAISAMYMMSLSTMSGEIFSVLKKCHVPKLIIELMNMMYRFIFILLDTNSKMRNSAESRLGYTNFRKALYSFGSTASNLFVVSMKRGNQFFDAMEARCYDGDLRFLEAKKPVTRAQWLWGALPLAYFVCVWIMTFQGVNLNV